MPGFDSLSVFPFASKVQECHSIVHNLRHKLFFFNVNRTLNKTSNESTWNSKQRLNCTPDFITAQQDGEP